MNIAQTGPRILLAEDSPTNRLVIAAMLSQTGYAIDEAENGAVAVQAAAAHAYSLILMDLEMPDLDGLEAARRIRCLAPPHGEVPILAMTASDAAEERERCFAAGMDGFLTKPVEQSQLLEAVAHWTAGAAASAQGEERRPAAELPLLDRASLSQLEEDVGAELVPDILGTFVVESERRMVLLEACVEAADSVGVADQAHALKGSAGTFGAMAMRQAAHDLEQAGRVGDLATIARIAPELRRLLGETCERLRAEYPFLEA